MMAATKIRKIQFVGGPLHGKDPYEVKIHDGAVLVSIYQEDQLHTYQPVGKLAGGAELAVYIGLGMRHHRPLGLCSCSICPVDRWKNTKT